MNKKEFVKDATPLDLEIDGNQFAVDTKVFKTGSLGWFLQDTIQVKVGGKTVEAKINLNVTIPGTKK